MIINIIMYLQIYFYVKLCSYLLFTAENISVFVNGFDVFFLEMLPNFDSNVNDEAKNQIQSCIYLKNMMYYNMH